MNDNTNHRLDPRVFPLGDSAITFEFGTAISLETNAIAVSLSDSLFAEPFPGFIESVPAYSSVTVFYDPKRTYVFQKRGESSFDAVTTEILQRLLKTELRAEKSRDPITIPVDFSRESAPDLEFVAASNGITPETVIELFTSLEYRVCMLGFLPGFPYMAHVDRRIAAPRLETPRKKVPKGSVGIAGRQTGIYPMESPGGWRLIGKTDVDLFLRDASRPTLFAPGDTVRFLQA